ncbi:LysM peptidoglycan-binding domain-containing protein [Candidatus Saccharibacteria bacterium]|nr:LysM peptidoglycan-binding domain-containing protein [Candidatus Saccharibacteria bacterium]
MRQGIYIRNSITSSRAAHAIKHISNVRVDRKPEFVDAWRDGRSRPRLKRQLFTALFAIGNIAAVLAVLFLVLGSQTRHQETPAVLSTDINNNQLVSRPLDQISSADIAVNLASLGNFTEKYEVAIQASAVQHLSEQTAPVDAIADKPQVVNTTIRTRKDISTYVVAKGDTVASVASKYSVSQDSIRWSNGINGNLLDAGKELLIPPPGLNGIVYIPSEDDTIDSIAKKYQTEKDRLISFNDLEDGVLPVGEPIFLPDGRKVTVTRTYVSRTISANGQVVGGYTPLYGANGYVYGHCTYYVATRLGSPNGLGNGGSWDNNGPRFGYTVVYTNSGGKPVAGGIAGREPGNFSYYGHVAVVEAVSADGTMLKYSDMNGLGGWNRVYYSDWVPISEFDWFMY